MNTIVYHNIMNTLFMLLGNARHWLNTKVTKPPLTGQDAWIISNIGQRGEYDKLYERFVKDLFTSIENTAKSGYTEYLLRFPKWLSADSKTAIRQALEDKNFNVLYTESSFTLISWNNGQ